MGSSSYRRRLSPRSSDTPIPASRSACTRGTGGTPPRSSRTSSSAPSGPASADSRYCRTIGEPNIPDRILDALQWFTYQRTLNTERELQGQEALRQAAFSQEARNILTTALEKLLGGGELEAFAAFEFGDDVWTVVVVADAAHLVRLEQQSVEIRFLGQVRGGNYTERFERGASGLRVTSRFEHGDLPDPRSFEFSTEPVSPAAIREQAARARDDQLELLRTKLREWSRLPSPR